MQGGTYKAQRVYHMIVVAEPLGNKSTELPDSLHAMVGSTPNLFGLWATVQSKPTLCS